MEIRFPANTPRVSRAPILGGKEVILIDGVQFEAGARRLVVGPEVSEETMTALALALQEIDNRDASIRWVTDLLAKHPSGSQ